MGADKLLRVTQLNAIFLDKEIYNALMHIIHNTSKCLPPGYIASFEPEINLLVRLILLRNSICKNDATFGQQLLSIKYNNLSSKQKVIYLISNCFEYIQQRLEYWNPRHKINTVIFKLQAIIAIMHFINMSIFLRTGKKPSLIDRCLGLEQVYITDKAPHFFDSKYLAREFLWSGFIDILINILPLINYHKLKRTVKYLNPLHKKPTYVALKSRVMTMHTKCAHCGEKPILPYHMGCSHIFCYTCLKGNLTADSKYECPICEHTNTKVICERVSVL